MSKALLAKRQPPPKFSKRELLSLDRYDKMVTAVAECQEVDEIKDIRDKSEALEKYAKAAKHYESELRAMDIRLRASARAGQLIAEGQKNGTIAPHGGDRKSSSQTTNLKPPTLAQLGISGDQSSEWQKLAGIPVKQFEEQLPAATGKRTSPRKILHAVKPTPDPEEMRRQHLGTLALRVWGRVSDILGLTEKESIAEVVSEMDKELVDGLLEAVPKAVKFLNSLEEELQHAARGGGQ
jgi:hypothetical protein